MIYFWKIVKLEGPGCSSLGFGAFMEHGPFQPGENGQLLKNEYSWNLGKTCFRIYQLSDDWSCYAVLTSKNWAASNMLYVESPIGVGFSYSNTSSDYNLWNDSNTGRHFVLISREPTFNILISFNNGGLIWVIAAGDNLRFIVNWLEEFPQYKDSEFFLTGESYAGK